MDHRLVVGAGLRARLFVLYALAALLGRAAIVDGGGTAVVWPAAGIAVAWLVCEQPKPGWLVDIPLLTIANAIVCVATGASWALTGVLVTSHLVGIVTILVLVRRWSPVTGTRSLAPLDTPRSLFGFLAATGAGCVAGVALGGLLLWAYGETVDPVALVTWWGRNVCGVVGVGTTALMILHRGQLRSRESRTDDGGPLELGVLLGTSALLLAVDYLSSLPVSFLLPAATVWAGMRFTPLVVAAHTLAGGGAVLGLTVADRGPFATASDLRTGTLLAQLFIAMTFAVGLFLAAMREQTASLQADLLAQERDRQEELRTFARRVAHDLRTPLTVIDGWVDELAACLDRTPLGAPPDAADLLMGIGRASGRMRALVDDLLADATASDRVPEPQDVQLDDVVRQVAHDLGQPHAVQVDTTLVRGDPVLLHQLVDNLLGNAFKYVRPGEPADVAVTSRVDARGRVVVRVADRGVGIPDDAREWIFEPFRRAHGGDVAGTGLGLSTCRRIVERHGGRIAAQARLDGPGSVFEFDLPSTMSALPARPAPTNNKNEPAAHPWLTDAARAG